MIGTYILRDELLLATPPPHPSEGPPTNPNPLNTTIAPPTAGTKLSFAIIAPRHSTYQAHQRRPDSPSSRASGSGGSSASREEGSNHTSNAGSIFRPGYTESNGDVAPVFGHANPALATTTSGQGGGNVKEGGGGGKKGDENAVKRRKPKNSLVKSSSTFISRVIPHEGLKERLAEHAPEGLFAFANVNRAFTWLDLSSPTKVWHAHSHFPQRMSPLY